MNTCKNCSAQLHAGQKYCYGCGKFNGTADENDLKLECEAHPDRRAGGLCVVCSKPVCTDCEVKVDGKILCTDPEHRILLQEWCILDETDSEFEAEALVRNLADGGIEARMFSLHDHAAAHWLHENRIVLFVRIPENEKAKMLLRELNFIGND
jgi:hypothetical protein